jgi:hypothetical protein
MTGPSKDHQASGATRGFVTWSFVITIGFGLFLSEWLRPLGIFFLGVSSLILMTPAERHKPLSARRCLLMLAFFAAVIAFIVAANRWLPEAPAREALSVMSHPAFVIPCWTTILLIGFYRWRAGKKPFIRGRTYGPNEA